MDKSKIHTRSAGASRAMLAWTIVGVGMMLAQATGLARESAPALTLDKAVRVAQRNDPWLVENRHTQDAIESMSVAAGQLPDPKLSAGLVNFPTDTFNFGQEPVSQVKVGISQMFPRGQSLRIRKEQLQILGNKQPFLRADRRAKVAVTASQLWLDAYKAQESIALIEKDRALFEQLADVAQSSYGAALGKTRQQDIIRAQLELTRLDDRLTMLNQMREMSQQRLLEWLGDYFLDEYGVRPRASDSIGSTILSLDRKLPNIALMKPQFYGADKKVNSKIFFGYLFDHPSVLALDKAIAASDAGIDLARQKYKPSWGVKASYAVRGDSPMGQERADFFSLGVTLDLPLFTANRQDKQLEAAVSSTDAVRTKKWQMLRKMKAAFETARVALLRLNERQALFATQLLPQMHEQAEASLTAYTNDDGDFAEVVRARIAELNAQIDALGIDVDRQKTIAKLNYYFVTNTDAVMSTVHAQGDEK